LATSDGSVENVAAVEALIARAEALASIVGETQEMVGGVLAGMGGEARERVRRQHLWLGAKEDLEPGKWSGVGFRYDLNSGKMTPLGDSWTPAMRKEFGRFQGGLLSAANGAQWRRHEYDAGLVREVWRLKAEHGWGRPSILAHLKRHGYPELKDWQVRNILAEPSCL
jgi:hypothetical protein